MFDVKHERYIVDHKIMHNTRYYCIRDMWRGKMAIIINHQKNIFTHSKPFIYDLCEFLNSEIRLYTDTILEYVNT